MADETFRAIIRYTGAMMTCASFVKSMTMNIMSLTDIQNRKDFIMIRLLAATSALALAAVPALAQQTDPAGSMGPDAATTGQQQSAQQQPMQSEPAPAPAEPAAQPAPEDKATQAAKLVEAEFPTYDADGNGELSQAEFSKWMLALHAKAEADGAAGAKAKTAAEKDSWAKQAFLAADKDKSKKVSKTELATFLQG
jgi:hypothetical protein